MTSVHDLYPLNYYKFPFCKPDVIHTKHENLGEFLVGDRIESSPYIIKMEEDLYCKVLCKTNVGRAPSKRGSDSELVQGITLDY